jgi:FkbM family methyltransferase
MNWERLCDLYGLPAKVTGVLHAGARMGEEAADYVAADIANVWWIEANDGVIPQLRFHVEPLGHHVIPALLGERDDVLLPFHITNHDGMSSSVLQFGTHLQHDPSTHFVDHRLMRSHRIDSLVAEFDIHPVNMLVMDLQGYEGPVLRGATELLPQLDFVMSEVNSKQVYIGATQVEELDEILSDFDRVETLWVADQGWGDALWARR